MPAMQSVSTSRRLSAVVALLATVSVFCVLAVMLASALFLLLVVAACLALAIAVLAYALVRTGIRRYLAIAVALLAFFAAVVLLVLDDSVVLLTSVVVLIAIVAVATRYALGRDLTSLKHGPTPGTDVEPARRGVLLMNLKSGGGKAQRLHLDDEARRRGIEPVILGPGDDAAQLAEDAIARGADVIGMAGGDGSQGLVAGVAASHGVAYVCVPAGTRNHLAMDLGLDRNDVVGALGAFGPAVERRIDLGLLGDRVFVNNASIGLYAKIVQSHAYRSRKVGTALEMLPDMLGPDATPFDLQFTGPDGTEHENVHVILVSNDRYELSRAEGFGSRRRLDLGTLGIVAARFESAREASAFAGARSSWHRPRGWLEWSAPHFEVRSSGPIEVGVDGEALQIDPPLHFRTSPAALRVRIPRQAPGYSPAAIVATPGWGTLRALLQVSAGRPVTIEP
jgi:diacylglycerol kinase family enzyme